MFATDAHELGTFEHAIRGTYEFPAQPLGTPTVALRAAITRSLREGNVPGASVAVVDHHGLRWADGFGVANLDTGEPARVDTIYHLFSGTKLFTATAIMQLVEQGLVTLDDSVARYVPAMRAVGDISLRHLLSHQSGLRDSLRGLLAVHFPDEPAPDSTAALHDFRLSASRPAGTRVEYLNVNYALLGEVITRVTGTEYRTHVTRAVLAPLGDDLSFTSVDAWRARAATGYIDRWDPMRVVLRALFPAVTRRLYGTHSHGMVALNAYALNASAIGGLIGTVSGFAQFLQRQMTDGGELLRPESVRLMQTMLARGAAGIESREGVGLGWKFGRVGATSFLNHEGGGAGFTSELRMYPDAGIGVAIAMNAMRMPRTMRVAHRIAELIRTMG
jgi:D-alanyl-D-alanine carboxypeptidase